MMLGRPKKLGNHFLTYSKNWSNLETGFDWPLEGTTRLPTGAEG